MSRRIIVEDRHTASGWGIILLAAIIVAYGKEIMIVGLCMLATYALLAYLKHREQMKALRAVNEAYASMELEDRYVNAPYPYDTMPLTYPICETFPYRSNNDGMRDWK